MLLMAINGEDADKDWAATICALNNYQYVSNTSKRRVGSKEKIQLVLTLLKLFDITNEQLNSLNVIHISGTKGKGSTCTFVESILRHRGYKTGLFTSPNLISVRERIRINGRSLTQEKFIKYFWHVNNHIQKKFEKDMVGYFMFLTVMGIYLFIQEKIDVLILETGIGGQFDCTNIVKQPVATGITSLDYDHQKVLGYIIESIAWHKAGIFKQNVPAIVAPPIEAAKRVILERATEIGCPVHIAPPLDSYELPKDCKQLQLGIAGDVQTINASVALQLANIWLKRMKRSENQTTKNISSGMTLPNGSVMSAFPLDSIDVEALANARLGGRCQILVKGRIHYYLDGAHTPDSLEHTARWFQQEFAKHDNKKNIRKVLLFNLKGNRDADILIKPLMKIQFDRILNSPNLIDKVQDPSSESANFTTTNESVIENCKSIASLIEEYISEHQLEASFHEFDCLRDTIGFINNMQHAEPEFEIHILITGSLHLVGNSLSLIDDHHILD